MNIRLVKWFIFSIILGLLPLGIKSLILYFCNKTIGYNDVYSEIIFFDLILNVGVVKESVSIKEHKVFQIALLSCGILSVIVLATIFGMLIFISYGFATSVDFKKMIVPTAIFSISSFIMSLTIEILEEVEK